MCSQRLNSEDQRSRPTWATSWYMPAMNHTKPERKSVKPLLERWRKPHDYTHQGLLTTLISADEVIWLRAAIRRLLKSADDNFLMELKGTLFQTCHSQTRKEEGEM